MTLEHFFQEKKAAVEEQLIAFLKDRPIPEPLKASMAYSLEAGGKRLRPILMFAVIEACGGDAKAGVIPACALELVHTYSLIHDDLPAMDNDDLRRGKPTNHKQFGEATAILAGDALLTLAFECLAESPILDDQQKVSLIRELAKAAGPVGMVGGQMADMEAEGRDVSIDELEQIHLRKTGRLLEYAVIAGAIIAGVNQNVRRHLSMYARHMGIAFQIKDDILDVEGNEATMGKSIGSDDQQQKNTYPKLLNLGGAKKKLCDHYQRAIDELNRAEVDDHILKSLAKFIIEREY